jgi:hypothetical protein
MCRIGAEINRQDSERNHGRRIIQTFRRRAAKAVIKRAFAPPLPKRKTLILP